MTEWNNYSFSVQGLDLLNPSKFPLPPELLQCYSSQLLLTTTVGATGRVV